MRYGRTDRDIAEAIRSRREALAMSEEALARPLNLSVDQLREREGGKVRFSASELHAACHALDLNVVFRR